MTIFKFNGEVNSTLFYDENGICERRENRTATFESKEFELRFKDIGLLEDISNNAIDKISKDLANQYYSEDYKGNLFKIEMNVNMNIEKSGYRLAK